MIQIKQVKKFNKNVKPEKKKVKRVLNFNLFF